MELVKALADMAAIGLFLAVVMVFGLMACYLSQQVGPTAADLDQDQD